MRKLNPPIEEKIGEKLSIVVSHVGMSRSRLPNCRVAIWNGKLLHSDIFEPDKAEARKSFVKSAVVKDPDIKDLASIIDEKLLGLAEILQSQPSNSAPTMDGPTVEFLDSPPKALTKPLLLIDGRAYAATWLYVKTTISQRYDEKAKKLVDLDPPEIQIERRPFVVDQDGTLYGDNADKPLSELGFEVKLADPPPDDRLWSNAGVQAFRAGQRPDPADVFCRITGAYDYYLDFSRSLGTQEQMCRLSGCESFATWIHEACDVMGYPWPSGDRGSGKTKWGNVFATTSYLGMIITAGGSFAALRDLAEHGATLVFDDAENLADPKKSDPDKRALLLAGNRRGVMIPLKEQVGDKWQTRWVNAYAPRAFTAIALPDEVLQSRSLIIPLVRSGDRERANRDPGGREHWPCNVVKLKDDLWATALQLLPEAAEIWRELDTESSAFGRDLEPWRAAIVTARLLERHGVEGLEADIRAVMQATFEERNETVGADRGRATVLGIVRYVEQFESSRQPSDVSDVRNVSDVYLERSWSFTAKEIAEKLKELATEASEDDDVEAGDWASPKAIGWQLTRLRLRKAREATKKRTRQRTISGLELRALAQGHGISSLLFSRPPDKTSETSNNVQTSNNKQEESPPKDSEPRAHEAKTFCAHCEEPGEYNVNHVLLCEAHYDQWATEQGL